MKHDVKVCLDEIDACYVRLLGKPMEKDDLRRLNRWVNLQKRKLKDLKYKGKIPRRPSKTRSTSSMARKTVKVPEPETPQPEVDENIGRLCIFGELPEFG